MLNFEPCCTAQTVYILIAFILSVIYEQINDDDDDEASYLFVSSAELREEVMFLTFWLFVCEPTQKVIF